MAYLNLRILTYDRGDVTIVNIKIEEFAQSGDQYCRKRRL